MPAAVPSVAQELIAGGVAVGGEEDAAADRGNVAGPDPAALAGLAVEQQVRAGGVPSLIQGSIPCAGSSVSKIKSGPKAAAVAGPVSIAVR